MIDLAPVEKRLWVYGAVGQREEGAYLTWGLMANEAEQEVATHQRGGIVRDGRGGHFGH